MARENYLSVVKSSVWLSVSWFVLVVGSMLFSLPSCQHEPEIIEPDPADTTHQPMDTTNVDTSDVTTGIPCSPDSVYFERDILPLLRSNCAKSGCHDAGSHQEGIILDNYENTIASDVIRAFDLDQSDLYEVITENDPDKIMPQPPNQPLSQDQINLIAKWIQQGARNLTCDDMAGQCNTENISYAAFVAPLISANCAGCHSGPTASGNIVLTSHAGVKTVAENGRLLGAITWANGYQRMPKGSNQLSDCKIEKIKAWINDGAPNN